MKREKIIEVLTKYAKTNLLVITMMDYNSIADELLADEPADSEIRSAIVKSHTFEGKCNISEYAINQLLEGAVWYQNYFKNNL